MKKSLYLLFICAAVALISCNKSDLKSDKSKVSYGLGLQFAHDIKSRGIEVDVDAFSMGVEDALSGKEKRLSDEELRQAFQNYSRVLAENRNAQSGENLQAGEVYLQENQKKEGVMVTKSGLQYRVLKQGTGISPKASDIVTVHYSGRLIDGTEFDSSYKRNKPAVFQLGKVIPGWTEGLQLMKVGSKYELTIPADLGYGDRGTRGIPGNSVLIFDVELLDVKKK